MNRKTLAAAFKVTIPVLMGYLSVGVAFGLMLEAVGYNFIWSAIMSISIFAGSMQYVGVSLIATAAVLTEVAFMTLMINFRHIVYGLSMLDKFRGMGKAKLYMIFSLTDETYALLSSAQAPEGVSQKKFYLAIATLNHLYWIIGSVIGSIFGSILTLNIAGVDFAMTALFVVICVDQWRSGTKHAPAIIGAASAVVFLLIAGSQSFLLPALVAIVILLLAFRRQLDDNGEEAQ